MPIEPSAAVKLAYEYLMKVSPDVAKISNFRVEEIKLDDDSKNFLITLSYEYMGEFPFERKREYKDFVVNQDAGVISMTIRKL